MPRSRPFVAVVGLLLLAPVCAEYLSAYDTSTGDLGTLLAGFLVLAPLYGAPALLIREVGRRSGLGWPGLLLLAAAFGVVQAGLVDQSVFAEDYRSIAYWPELWDPTYVPGLDLSAYAAVAFVLGHVVFSFAAPILLVEELSGRRAEPWLRTRGIVAASVAYVAAAALVLVDHVDTEGWQLSGPQLVGVVVVTGVLVLAAFRVRRPTGQPSPGRVPSPWLLLAAGVALELGLSWSLVWPTLVPFCAALVVLGVGLHRWGRRAGWTVEHALLLVGGALATRAVGGFFGESLGDTPDWARHTHSTVMTVLVVTLVVLAVAHARRTTPRPAPGSAVDR